ncbi:MAG: carbon storage regulator [Planctomycetota bacterium]
MLILSRKVDQEILIGDDVRLTVVRIDANRVRIGIDAPDEVRILRGELAAKEMANCSEQPFELSDRENAFAHEQAMPSNRRVSRVSREADPRIFSGIVDTEAASVVLREDPPKQSTPLANFVSAS